MKTHQINTHFTAVMETNLDGFGSFYVDLAYWDMFRSQQVHMGKVTICDASWGIELYPYEFPMPDFIALELTEALQWLCNHAAAKKDMLQPTE